MLPSIHHREARRLQVFVGMKASTRTIEGLVRAQSPAAQMMEQKWAVMPIAVGILGSLEQLSDSSLQ